MLGNKDVPDDGNRYAIVGWKQWSELLNITEFANADYVGKQFPEEARKMHYGETEHRSIYGEASPDDAKALHEEGIEFHAIPTLPEERN